MYPSCMSRGTGDHLVPWGGGDGDGEGGGGGGGERAQTPNVLALLSQLMSRCGYLFSFCCVRRSNFGG